MVGVIVGHDTQNRVPSSSREVSPRRKSGVAATSHQPPATRHLPISISPCQLTTPPFPWLEIGRNDPVRSFMQVWNHISRTPLAFHMPLLFQDKSSIGLLFCITPDARIIHHHAPDSVPFWVHLVGARLTFSPIIHSQRDFCRSPASLRRPGTTISRR